MNIIQQLEAEEAQRLAGIRKTPDFQPGDTLRVHVRIKEGERDERVFPVLSPMIESIEVKRRGAVRRAKLYYLRDRRGKSARIAERAAGAKVVAEEPASEG